jgi:hypothetical protein
MSNGRAQPGGNGAGPSAFSMYASRFLNGNGRETAVEGSQVSIFLKSPQPVFGGIKMSNPL